MARPVLQVLPVLAILVFLRRPETLTDPAFFQEDGQVFYLGTYFGSFLENATRPYQGYIHLLPRIGGELAALVAVAEAPLVANIYSLLVALGVATFVSSDRMADVWPGPRARFVAAATVVLLPASSEILGSTTYTQWLAAIFLLARLAARSPVTPAGRAVDGVAVLAAGLSSPLVVVFAPIAIARRQTVWPVYVSGAVVQLVAAVSNPRIEAVGQYDATSVIQIVSTRVIVEPLLGARLTGALYTSSMFPVAALVCLCGLIVLAIALRSRIGWRPVIAATILGLGTVAIGLAAAPDKGYVLVSPDAAQRYFYVWGALVAAGVVIAGTASTRRFAAILPASLLLVGVIWDFRMPPRPSYEWVSRSQCIGHESPCLVPVEPPAVWTLRWPGVDGNYSQTPIGRRLADEST